MSGQSGRPGQPTVISKELERVVLLRPRSFRWRLDVGPFYAVYALLLLALIVNLTEGNTAWVRYTSYAYGVFGVLHMLLFLFTQWSVRVRAIVGYYIVSTVQQATSVLAIPAKFSGAKELVKVVHSSATGPEAFESSWFEFRKHKFIYNPQQNTFEKQKFPVKETFEHYANSSGYGSEAKVKVATEKWGPNQFEVPLPPFMSLLKEQMLAPFFVFQVFCVGLWCLDEYWYYSLFTLFMLITFECTVVNQRLRNLTELRSLSAKKQTLQVYRGGRWDARESSELLPGDVVSIIRPAGAAAEDAAVPADCLLLAGSCIVEEAVLTGESTPQWKVSISGATPEARLDIKNDKQYMLFGGTKVLQHTGDKSAKIKTPDGGCLAVVLRTGFETSQGQLMRTILYSTERVTANNLETGIFILFLLFFAVSAAYYVMVNGLADEKRSRFKLTLNCIMIITSVIPPELPMELSIAVNASLVALARKSVFCTEPFRIPFAGKVEVCCFDKTGTLTTDHLLLEGIAACGQVEGEAEEDLHRNFSALPPTTQRVLASCHALALVGEEVIGDPLEKASVEAVDWSYSADVSVSQDKKTRCTILHRNHFSSVLKRMSAIIKVESETGISHAAVLKGAPEVVKQFLAEVPASYDRVYRSYASHGGRVIALAYRDLPDELDAAALRALSREELEAQGGMQFCGFAVFQCPLKEESEPALRQLAESSHQLMMITGDAPLTACYAASQVHIVTQQVLVLGLKEGVSAPGHGAPAEDALYQWVSPDQEVVEPFSRSWAEVLQLASQYDLCVSGDALLHLEAAGVAAKIIPLVQVYARVSPEQKELILKTLRHAGHVSLMCGDGTNDVGGLKAAHVGVALLTVHKPEGKRAKAKAKELAEKKKKKAPKKKTKGQLQLEEWRKLGRPVTPQMERMAELLDRMDTSMTDTDVPMLKPGDASMAAPFTAKATGVAPCTDIIKQGRCTLVTTVQMFKILGLLCLSTAYSLSVMYLQGVKLSDIQATLMGFLTAGLFFFISNSKPLERLSTTRPHPSIFNPYFFLSLIGQFAIHMTFLVYMYHQALAQMPEDQRQEPDTDFQPNLVNSVCYIVQAVVQLTTFAANYVGHPFNSSIRENRGLLTCLHYSTLFLMLVTSGVVPSLSSGFGLVDLPMGIKAQLLLGSVGTFFGCFYLEHVLRHGLPAATPPNKGYLWHKQELRVLKKRN